MPPQFGNYLGDFIIPLRLRVRNYAAFSLANTKGLTIQTIMLASALVTGLSSVHRILYKQPSSPAFSPSLYIQVRRSYQYLLLRQIILLHCRAIIAKLMPETRYKTTIDKIW